MTYNFNHLHGVNPYLFTQHALPHFPMPVVPTLSIPYALMHSMSTYQPYAVNACNNHFNLYHSHYDSLYNNYHGYDVLY